VTPIRIVARILCTLVWTVFLLVPMGVGLLVTARRPASWISWRARVVRLWARGAVRIIGARVVSTGIPPKPPFVLVANHVSYLDIILLASQLETIFVSRADVSSWPLVGVLARIAGTLFINRRNKKDVLRINGLIESIQGSGGGVMFFPEGTTSMGDDVHRFKASLLAYPASRGLPVSYAAISYRTRNNTPPTHEAICWWGDMTFVPHLLALLGLPGFNATVVFGPETVSNGERKILAQTLEDRIRSLFKPIVTSGSATKES
jgi:1-acyl-sn-glycerol-3-phosphate acyltransferase